MFKHAKVMGAEGATAVPGAGAKVHAFRLACGPGTREISTERAENPVENPVENRKNLPSYIDFDILHALLCITLTYYFTCR